MRTQILKINGVAPARLAKLHEHLDCKDGKQPGMSMSDVPQGVCLNEEQGEPGLNCHLLRSEFNSRFNTYTVEIQVPVSASVANSKERAGKPKLVGPHCSLFASRQLVDDIYKALGIYPELEMIGDETRPVPMWDDTDDEDEIEGVPSLAYRFVLHVYNGEERILKDHLTRAYYFANATELAYALLQLTNLNARSRSSMTYPHPINESSRIKEPHLQQGYGPNTTVVVKKIIPVGLGSKEGL